MLPQTPESVYAAWTEPRHLKNWWKVGEGWETDVVEVDPRIGGSIVLGVREVESGRTHVVRGVFRELVPGRRLVFTFTVEGEDPLGEEVVTVDFIDFHGDTKMNLKHTKAGNNELSSQRNLTWIEVLDQLAEYLPRGK